MLLLILPLLINPHGMLEQVGYLPRLYNTLVTTPTGVSKLLTELTEQVGFFFVLG